MPFPHWHSNKTNVDRTNEIIRQIAIEFGFGPRDIPIIAPLNECVFSDKSSVIDAESWSQAGWIFRGASAQCHPPVLD
jgi:hypothetical protein